MAGRPSKLAITPRVVFGFGLIAMGVLFTLDNVEVFDARDLWRYAWPVLLVVVGLSKVLWPGTGSEIGVRVLWSGTGSGSGVGVAMAVVGGLFLLDEDRLGYIRFDFWDLVPLLLVLMGASMVWGGIFGRRRYNASAPTVINAVSILSGSNLGTASDAFQGGDLVAFMGGVEVDLSRAQISDGPAVIDAFAFWGGIEIRIPRDWAVRSRCIPILAGFEDKSEKPVGEPAGVLIVKGFAVMGGIEIKN